MGISHLGKQVKPVIVGSRLTRRTSPSESDQQRQGVQRNRKGLTPMAKFRLRRPVLAGAKGLRPHGASPDEDRPTKAGRTTSTPKSTCKSQGAEPLVKQLVK